MIEVLKVINEIDLQGGTYGQALVLSDGKNTAVVPLSDTALETFMSVFQEYLGAFVNAENDQTPEVPEKVTTQSSGKADAKKSKAAELPEDFGQVDDGFGLEDIDWEISEDATEEEESKP